MKHRIEQYDNAVGLELLRYCCNNQCGKLHIIQWFFTIINIQCGQYLQTFRCILHSKITISWCVNIFSLFEEQFTVLLLLKATTLCCCDLWDILTCGATLTWYWNIIVYVSLLPAMFRAILRWIILLIMFSYGPGTYMGILRCYHLHNHSLYMYLPRLVPTA